MSCALSELFHDVLCNVRHTAEVCLMSISSVVSHQCDMKIWLNLYRCHQLCVNSDKSLNINKNYEIILYTITGDITYLDSLAVLPLFRCWWFHLKVRNLWLSDTSITVNWLSNWVCVNLLLIIYFNKQRCDLDFIRILFLWSPSYKTELLLSELLR
jgi:hypothetical protein